MKKALAVLALPLAVALTACGVATSEVDAAKEDAKKRGFTVLSVSSGEDLLSKWIDLDVTFGKGGCKATLYAEGDPRLSIELPVPGTTTETEHTYVDDPRVNDLESIPAFKHCFKDPDEKPKS